jgi:hypothetical protein
MKMVGIYHIDLLADADEADFEAHMAGDAVDGVLQLTRVTSGFDCQLLKRAGEPAVARRYAWHVTAQLVGGGYDFAQNVERLGAAIARFGTVAGVDAYSVMPGQQPVTG